VGVAKKCGKQVRTTDWYSAQLTVFNNCILPIKNQNPATKSSK
jgi:hypothetical protein